MKTKTPRTDVGQGGQSLLPRSTCPLQKTCQELGVTQREHEVCQWLIQGKTNAEIGRILFISPRTAEKHVHKVLRKLRVENRTTAVAELLRRISQATRPPDERLR